MNLVCRSTPESLAEAPEHSSATFSNFECGAKEGLVVGSVQVSLESIFPSDTWDPTLSGKGWLWKHTNNDVIGDILNRGSLLDAVGLISVWLALSLDRSQDRRAYGSGVNVILGASEYTRSSKKILLESSSSNSTEVSSMNHVLKNKGQGPDYSDRGRDVM